MPGAEDGEVVISFKLNKEGLLEGVDQAGKSVLEFAQQLMDLADKANAAGESLSTGFIQDIKEGLTEGMTAAGASAETIGEMMKVVDEATRASSEAMKSAGEESKKAGDGMKEAGKGGEQAAGGMKKAGDAADEAGKKMKESAGGLKEWVQNALGLDAVFRMWDRAKGIAESVVDFFRDGIKDLTGLHDLNRETGISVEMLDDWSIALRANGVSATGFAAAIRGMGQAMTEANSGIGKAGPVIAALGVSFKELKTLSPEEQFKKLGAAVAGIEDPMQRQQAAFELFKRGFKDVLRLFGDGVPQIEDFIKYSKGLATAIDDNVVNKASDITGAMTKLGVGFEAIKQGFFVGLVQGLAPFLQALATELLPVFRDLISISRDFGKSIGDALKGAIPYIHEFAERVKEVGVWQAIKEEWLELEDWLANQYDGLGGKLSAAATRVGVAIGKAMMQGIKDEFANSAPDITAWFKGWWDSLQGIESSGEKEFQINAELTRLRDLRSQRGGQGQPSPEETQLGVDVQIQNRSLNEQVAAANGAAGAVRNLGAAQEQTGQKTGETTKKIGEAADATDKQGEAARKGAGHNAALDAALSGAGQGAAKLTDDIKRLQAGISILEQAAGSGTDLGDALRKAAVAATEVPKGMNAATVELKKFTEEQYNLAVATTQQTKAANEQAAQSDLFAKTLDDAMASGLTYGQALLIAAEAAAKLADKQQVAQLTTQKLRDEFIAAQERMRAAAQEKQAETAVGQISQNTKDLERQIELEQEVQSGVLGVKEAQRQWNIEQEVSKLLAQNVKGDVVDMATKFVDAQQRLKDLQATGIELGQTLQQAFDQSFDAIISGTRKLSDVWEGIGLSLAKQLFDKTLTAKIGFDSKFSGNILDLAGSVVKVLGGSFENVFNYAASLFGPGGGGGFADVIGGGSSTAGAAGIGGLGGLGFLGGAAAISSGGFFSTSNPIASLGLSGLSLTSSALSLTGTSGGLMGLLFGSGAASTTLGSILPSSGGLLGSLFGTSSSAGAGIFADVVGGGSSTASGAGLAGATLGDIAGAAGGVIGGAGGIYSAFQLGGGGLNTTQIAASVVSIVAGAAAVLNAFPLIGSVIYAVLVAVSALIGVFMKHTPTAGAVLRAQSESILDNFKTFQDLQSQLGDITESMGNYKKGSKETVNTYASYDVRKNELTGSDTAAARGFGEEAATNVAGFAGVFAADFMAASKVIRDGNPILMMAAQQNNVLSEFFSRAKMDAAGYATFTATELKKAFDEMGVDVVKALGLVNTLSAAYNKALVDQLNPKIPKDRSGTFGVNVAETIRGVGSIFESDTSTIPPGVHIAALAVQELEKDGVKAFDTLSGRASDFFVKMADDAETFDKVVNDLLQQGFSINTDELKARLADIIASAKELGASIGGLFSAPTFEQGMQSMIQHMKQTLETSLGNQFMAQLFGKTNFAAVFEPMFAALDKMKDYDLTKSSGISDFMAVLLPAIAQGKANLEDYIPILKEMYQAAKDAGEAIDKALEPTQAEKMAEAITTAFQGIGQVFSDSIQAGLAVLSQGGTMEQATDAFNQTFKTKFEATIKQAIFNGLLQTAVIAPFIAQWAPQFAYVVSAGMIYGFTDPRVVEAMASITQQAEAQAAGIGQLFVGAGVDAFGVMGDAADRFWAKMASDIANLKSSMASTVGGIVSGAIEEAMTSGKPIDWTKMTADLHQAVMNSVVSALIDAMVSSAVIEGGLAPLLEQLKVMSAAAWADGVLSPDEKRNLETLVGTIVKGGKEFADVIVAGAKDAADIITGGAGSDSGLVKDKHAGEHLEVVDGDLTWVPDGRQFPTRTTGARSDFAGTSITGGTRSQQEAKDAQDAHDANGRHIKSTDDSTKATDDQTRAQHAATDSTQNFTSSVDKATQSAAGLAYAMNVLIDKVGSLKSTDTTTDTTTVTGGDTGGTGGDTGGPGTSTTESYTGGGVASAQSFDEAQTAGRTSPGTGPGITNPPPRTTPAPSPVDKPPSGHLHPPSWGPGGPIIGPDDPRNPANQPKFGAVEVKLNIDDVIKKFLEGGSLTDFQKALHDATAQAVIDGMIQAMLASGPIKNAIDKFNAAMSAATSKALKDGVIDAKEAADLEEEAKKYGAGIEKAVKAATPAIEAAGKALGLGMEKSTKDAISGVQNTLEQAMRAFFEGGSIQEFHDTFNKAIYDAMVTAMIQALVTTGPIAAMMTAFADSMGKMIADAMDPTGPGGADITPKEARQIKKRADRFGENMQNAVEELGPILGPIFESWAKSLGVDLKKEVTSVEGAVGGALKDAITNHQPYETFAQNVKRAIYSSIVDGMVKAFVDSAVIQGLLAGPLAIINDTFEKIANKQITIAQANAILLEQAAAISGLLDDPTFKQAFATIMQMATNIANTLGVTTDTVVQAAATTQDAAATACDGECQMQRRLVETSLGLGALNELGRAGTLTAGFYLPYNPATGGPGGSEGAGGIPDTLHNPKGTPSSQGIYSDEDWRRMERWERRKARAGPDDYWFGPPPAPPTPFIPHPKGPVGPSSLDQPVTSATDVGAETATTANTQATESLTAEVAALRAEVAALRQAGDQPMDLQVTDLNGDVILRAASTAANRSGKANQRLFPRSVVR